MKLSHWPQKPADSTNGLYMVRLDIGESHAWFGISAVALRDACTTGPGAALAMILNEIHGAAQSLEAQRERRPQVGARVHVRGVLGRLAVARIDRTGQEVRVWVCNYDAPDERIEVDWDACSYLDNDVGVT